MTTFQDSFPRPSVPTRPGGACRDLGRSMSLIRTQIGVLSPIRITTVIRGVPHATIVVIRYVVVPNAGDRTCTVRHRVSGWVCQQDLDANIQSESARAAALRVPRCAVDNRSSDCRRK